MAALHVRPHVDDSRRIGSGRDRLSPSQLQSPPACLRRCAESRSLCPQICSHDRISSTFGDRHWCGLVSRRRICCRGRRRVGRERGSLCCNGFAWVGRSLPEMAGPISRRVVGRVMHSGIDPMILLADKVFWSRPVLQPAPRLSCSLHKIRDDFSAVGFAG